MYVSTLATILMSWNHFNYSNENLSPELWSYFHDTSSGFTDAELSAFITDNQDQYFSPDTDERPAAEDVLVQRIPGDDYFMLIMAFYSKENYSKPAFTIREDETLITFRDDGKGYDKKAGDGLYTARIAEDVKQFRQQAVNVLQEAKKKGYKPYRFVNRELILDPDAAENFDTQKFDANEPVSISGLTSDNISDIILPGTDLDKIRQNSVFITNLQVVEDPTRTWNPCTQTGNVSGSWTFGTLMRQLASKRPDSIATDSAVSAFVLNWLNNWTVTQTINGDQVNARTKVTTQIITPWLNQSLAGGAPAGQLDMRFAPFKLTAIVNRFDLKSSKITKTPCGEGRFVFCLVNCSTSTASRMNVIFEYGINRGGTCSERKAWAEQWVNLKKLVLGSAQYNQSLQRVTDQFALCGTNPSKVNQSSLDQLRTNEVTLSNSPAQWELREFHIDNTGNNLVETLLPQTLAEKYNAKVVNNDVALMANFINSNAAGIKKGTTVIPATFQGFPFLAGKAHVIGSPTGQPPNVFHWDGTDSSNASTFITDNDARFNYSLNTCSGCHSGEPQTGFTQVDPVFFGTQATLSGFLTGRAGSGSAIDFDNNTINDTMAVLDAAKRPSANPKIRNFFEIERRTKGLKNAAGKKCGSALSISFELMSQRTNMVD